MNYNKEHVIKKQKALVSKTKKNQKKISVITFKYILIGIVAFLVLSIGTGLGMVKGIIANAPSLDQIDVRPDGYSTTIYNQKGKEIISLSDFDSNRIYVEIDKIPKNLQNAFVAIEDERFWDHNGIDIQGIIRAFFVGIKSGHFSEGASTLDQQLLKNNVFAVFGENTFMERLERKFQEQYLALKLEEKYTKIQILEYYLNTINLGQGTLGVQAASNRYFDKDVSDLTLSEAAVIAGITQNPTRYDPVTHPEDNQKRRTTVLKRMLEQEVITQKQYDKALKDDVYERIKQIDSKQSDTSIYSYFVDALIVNVVQDLQEKLGYNQTQAYNAIYRGGLSIYITQDSAIQKICDEVFADSSLFPPGTNVALSYRLSIRTSDNKDHNYSEYDVEKYMKKKHGTSGNGLIYTSKEAAQKAASEFKASVYNKNKGDVLLGEKMNTTIQPQASFTIMDQKTGYVKAIVGGRGEKTGNLTLNRATGTTRQPGSTFKIVSTFVPALDTSGMTLGTVFDDAPYAWPGTNTYVRTPSYKGLSTIRSAIRDSNNIVTAKTMEIVTPQVAYDYLLNLGFTTLVDKQVNSDGSIYSDIYPSMCLGGLTKGVTNLELTSSYAAIANQGIYTKPILYTKIVDHDGNVLYKNKAQKRQVMKDSTAWLLTNAMKDVVTSGTGTATRLNNMTSAGKTGTTTSNYDYWFSGYTPYYTASIWYGYDINTNFTASNTHKVIWKTIMDKINTAKKLKNKDFPSCSSITTAQICTKSGKLAVSGLCDHDPRGSTIRTEYFAKGTEPTEECDVHVKYTICIKSKLPVTPYCPKSDQISKVYIIRPEGSVGETRDTPYELPKNFTNKTCNIHTKNNSSLNMQSTAGEPDEPTAVPQPDPDNINKIKGKTKNTSIKIPAD